MSDSLAGVTCAIQSAREDSIIGSNSAYETVVGLRDEKESQPQKQNENNDYPASNMSSSSSLASEPDAAYVTSTIRQKIRYYSREKKKNAKLPDLQRRFEYDEDASRGPRRSEHVARVPSITCSLPAPYWPTTLPLMTCRAAAPSG
jgi:hypothetical protein